MRRIREMLLTVANDIDLSTRPDRAEDFEDWLITCECNFWQLLQAGKIDEKYTERQIQAFLWRWARLRGIDWLRKSYTKKRSLSVSFTDLIQSDDDDLDAILGDRAASSGDAILVELIQAQSDDDEWEKWVVQSAPKRADDIGCVGVEQTGEYKVALITYRPRRKKYTVEIPVDFEVYLRRDPITT
jgi:hypothetical protein